MCCAQSGGELGDVTAGGEEGGVAIPTIRLVGHQKDQYSVNLTLASKSRKNQVIEGGK